jgi:hypothetical protein
MITLSDERVNLIQAVATLIRNDWSMSGFDGRDVRDWLEAALYGTDADVAKYAKEVEAQKE